jgi:hypothetical protein
MGRRLDESLAYERLGGNGNVVVEKQRVIVSRYIRKHSCTWAEREMPSFVTAMSPVWGHRKKL